ARAEDFSELTDRAHHVRRSDHSVEIGPAFGLNAIHDLIAAYDVGSGLFRFLLPVGPGDYQDLLRFAEPVRHDHGAANHLIGVLRVDPEAHMDLDGLVEFGVLDLLEKR